MTKPDVMLALSVYRRPMTVIEQTGCNAS